MVMVVFWGVSLASGQSGNVRLANLQSDVERLEQTVGRLRVEVEALRRENREMREWLEERVQGGEGQLVSREALAAILDDFEKKVQAANRRSRATLVEEVSEEIEQLARQTQQAIQAMTEAMEGQPQVEDVVVFNDNYPQSGTSYTVKSGDSLALIARKLGSQVDWIRNANRLSSDIIFPGQELFIPLED